MSYIVHITATLPCRLMCYCTDHIAIHNYLNKPVSLDNKISTNVKQIQIKNTCILYNIDLKKNSIRSLNNKIKKSETKQNLLQCWNYSFKCIQQLTTHLASE